MQDWKIHYNYNNEFNAQIQEEGNYNKKRVNYVLRFS